MVWLGMILAMILSQSLQGWDEWGFRITVVSSLVANLVVAILSATRRRLAHDLIWRILGQVAKLLLWLAFQAAELAATNAIGTLSLCGSDASDEEKQVVAFWAPFLLLHLGGPDNLTAYALDENKISYRKWVDIFSQIVAVIYTIYKNTHRGARSWAVLLAASVVMLVAGVVSYLEKVVALLYTNMDSMEEDASTRSSRKNDPKVEMKVKNLKCRIESTKKRQEGRPLRDGEALLLAQDLFPIWSHALVDSSVNPDSGWQKASQMILLAESDDAPGWGWESMCKVAEMELSLMYDFLYTKAILAHSWSWCYYLIRLLSPLFTAAAGFLFSFWLHHDADRKQQIRGSYIGITYSLLAITLLMDVAWLLRALGSTWAYAYLQQQALAQPSQRTLRAAKRWWRSLHRLVVWLDPLRLFCLDPVSHRRWSGTIGRYNLLKECTATTATCCCQGPEWWPWSKAGDDKPKEMRYLRKIPQCVKKLLFERVTEILQQAINYTDKGKADGEDNEDRGEEEMGKKNMYSRVDIRNKWGHKAFDIYYQPEAADQDTIKLPPPYEGADEGKDAAKENIFGDEFEEDVLLWHIATCMILPHRQKGKHARAIEVLSEYMMFLVAVRRQMLPGLVLHSQLQVIRETLEEIWDGGNRFKNMGLTHREESNIMNKDKLAMILRRVRNKKPLSTPGQLFDEIEGNEGTRLLAHAVDLYFSISGDKQPGVLWPSLSVSHKRLEFIFNVWVDKLVYAAVRCSREGHAKQLSAGGDLTTVLWMLIQHAGPFCIGEAEKNIYIDWSMDHHAYDGDDMDDADHPPPSEPWPPSPPPREPQLHPREPQFHPWLPSLPPCCPPVCPPYYHPSYPPVCPPCHDPSCPAVCPWYPQCPSEEPAGDEPEETRKDEDEGSCSDDEEF